MRGIKYQRIPVVVPSAGAEVPFSADMDKLYEKLTGIALEFPWDNSLFASSLQMNVAGDELFAEGFEAKRLTSSQDVPPDDRFYRGSKDNPLQDPAKGNLVAGKFTDGGVTSGVTFPYTLQIYLRLENINETTKESE